MSFGDPFTFILQMEVLVIFRSFRFFYLGYSHQIFEKYGPDTFYFLKFVR